MARSFIGVAKTYLHVPKSFKTHVKTHQLCLKRVIGVCGKGGGNVVGSEGGGGLRGWRVVGVEGEEVGCGSMFVGVLFRGKCVFGSRGGRL